MQAALRLMSSLSSHGFLASRASLTTSAVLAISLLLTSCGGDAEVPTFTPEQIQQLRERSEAFAGRSAEQLQGDSAALSLGQELQAAHCNSCHQASGRNAATDLRAGKFNYGDSAEAIRTTITAGRHTVMPAFGGTLGEVELGAVVAHVRGFSLGNEPETFAATAATLYEQNCRSCHGADAKGNPALGVPDLTDTYWQHGGEMMNVRITITRGIEDECPAQGNILSAAEIELLTASLLGSRQQP